MGRKLLIVLLSVALAACGDDGGGSGSDGGPGGGDGGPGPDGADFGAATVTVSVADQPQADLLVVFHGPDGSIVGEATTDAAGSASHDIGRDSMITVVLSPVDLVTIAGVQPGDEVVLASPILLPTSIVGDVSVTAEANMAGADEYEIWIGCDLDTSVADATVATELTLRESCLIGDGVFDALGMAVDSGGDPIGYTTLTDITPDSGGTTSVTLPAWSAPASIELAYTGGPTDALAASGLVQSWRDSVAFPASTGGVPPSGGDATIALPYPADFADQIVARLAITRGTQTGITSAEILARRIASPPASLALSPADFLPSIEGATMDLATPARPVITVAGDTASADGVFYLLLYSTEGSMHIWRAAAPAGTTTFTFPELPASAQSMAPTASSIFGSQSGVQSMEATFLDSYLDLVTTVVLPYFGYYLPLDGEYTLRISTAAVP